MLAEVSFTHETVMSHLLSFGKRETETVNMISLCEQKCTGIMEEKEISCETLTWK